MKALLRATLIVLSCLIAAPVFAGDCSDAKGEIATNRNNPKELRKLLSTYPQCGEIYEALGDYFYNAKVWNEASSNYQEAQNLMPESKKIAQRIQELRGKQTALISDEQELLAYRRGIRGTTDSGSAADTGSMQLAMLTTSDSSRAASSQGSAQSSAQTSSNTAPAVKKAPAEEKAQAPKKSAPGNAVLASNSVNSNKKSRALDKAGDKDGLVQPEKIGLMIQFQYKSAEITPESKKLLEGVADMFQKEMAGKKVVILGHTDNVGGSEYNLKLSEERAESAKEFLIQHGVESYRLQARGVGKDQPICDNDTEEGRTKNRRVEFEISGL